MISFGAVVLVTAAVFAPSATPARLGAARIDVPLERQLLAELNAIRVRHGLPALRPSAPLRAAARAHSRDMAANGFFAHESSDGRSFSQRVTRWYRARAAGLKIGENLAWGAPSLSAADAVRLWLESPGHRANLLSRRWREIGVGAVHHESAPGTFSGRPTTLVTTDFGAR